MMIFFRFLIQYWLRCVCEILPLNQKKKEEEYYIFVWNMRSLLSLIVTNISKNVFIVAMGIFFSVSNIITCTLNSEMPLTPLTTFFFQLRNANNIQLFENINKTKHVRRHLLIRIVRSRCLKHLKTSLTMQKWEKKKYYDNNNNIL